MSRTYIVGLPVAITVEDDGTVTYDIDTAEASSAIWEDETHVFEDLIAEDARAIEADHDRRMAALNDEKGD